MPPSLRNLARAAARVIVVLAIALPAAAYAGGKPLVQCNASSVCPALFYYNSNSSNDVPTINKFSLVVLNHTTQLKGILKKIDRDTLALYYHLFDMEVENGPYYDWNTANAHEEWFLHDTNGNRIRVPRVRQRYWYMDVTNADFLAFKYAQYRRLLAAFPQLDGFYLDYPTFYGFAGKSGGGFRRYDFPLLSCTTDTCPATFLSAAAWNEAYVPALAALRAALPQALVINNNFLTKPFTGAADGSLGEHFFHPSFWGNSPVYLERQWVSQVNSLADASLAGRIPIILSGSTPTADVERWKRFSLASYLLGRRSDAASLFFFTTSPALRGAKYERLYGIAIGAPQGIFQKTNGVYWRSYKKGLVLVNPTTAKKRVALKQSYRYSDPDGKSVTGSITLKANTGTVLRIVR